MGKYNFAADVNNAEFLREKGIKDACIWSSIIMLAPWIVWAVDFFSNWVNWVVLGIFWILVPLCCSFHGQVKTSKFSYQTRFPSLMSLPISALAYFSLCKYYPNMFFPYDCPLSIFSTLVLILVVASIVNWIHFSIMACVDASISPSKEIIFTTRITELSMTRSKNSTSYWVHYIDHRLAPANSSISRSEYNSWKVGDVLQLSIRTYVINQDGSSVSSVKRLSTKLDVTDSDELLFEKSQSSDFVKEEISEAPSTVSSSFLLWLVLIISFVVFFFMGNDKCLFMNYGHPGYLAVLGISFAVSVLNALRERRKLLKICEYKSEPYNVWCDKLIKKLVLGTVSVLAFFGLLILVYDRVCSENECTTEIYSCKTVERYHKTKNSHYYTHHAIFQRKGESVYRDLKIRQSEMDCDKINIRLKKGLFGVPVICGYSVYR